MALNDDRNKKAQGLGNVSAGAPMPTQYARLIAMPDSAPSLSQAPQKPGAFARGLFDAGAVTTDIAKAPIKGLADGANRLAIGGYNILREGVGMQPVQPRQFNYSATQDDLAARRAENAQNPVAARPQIPAVAAPKSPTQQTPQRPSPSQRMTDSQANAAEVNARTATQTPASPQTGMGVPVGAGGAAPGGIVKSKDKNGNTVYTGTGAYAATGPAIAGTIGSVQNQSFGNPVVPQAQASIAQPRVASTFGMSVNDPRINDQTAPVARPQGVFRGPDAMAEAYNSREDREARQAALGNIDTQLFMLRGKNDPASLQAMADLTQTQAKLNAGAEGLSQEAQQGRANRGNKSDIAGMEQAGQTTRQRMAGDVASQGQFLEYDAKNRATDASLIDKPQYVTDAQGRYLRVGATGAAPVTDAAGSAIQMPPPAQAQQRDYGAEKRMDAYTNILNGMRDMNGQLPPDAAAQAAALVAQAPGAQQPQAQAPQAGTIKNGYRFKGGNPAEQKNWEKVQ